MPPPSCPSPFPLPPSAKSFNTGPGKIFILYSVYILSRGLPGFHFAVAVAAAQGIKVRVLELILEFASSPPSAPSFLLPLPLSFVRRLPFPSSSSPFHTIPHPPSYLPSSALPLSCPLSLLFPFPFTFTFTFPFPFLFSPHLPIPFFPSSSPYPSLSPSPSP